MPPVETPEAPPAEKVWTYEDYLALPDDGRRYEIIEGRLYVVNAPELDHQYAVVQISRQMSNFTLDKKLGEIIVAPFEIHLSPDTRPVHPDVLFIAADRLPSTSLKFFEGAPDLIVEVSSRSTVRTDRVIKFSTYEKAGVREYWIASPRTRSVSVFALTDGEYELREEYTGDDVIQSSVLNGLSIVTSSVFRK